MQNQIRAKASEMTTAVRTGQNDKIIDLMYPKVVELAGGHEKMMAILKNMIEEMKRSGFKMDSVSIGQPGEPVAGGSKLFAIVPQTAYLTGNNVKIEGPSFLLAISMDQGKTWYFLDGSALTPELVKQLFPDFPATLKLPAKAEPKITSAS